MTTTTDTTDTTAPAVEVVETDPRAEYTAGLRALADALDGNPKIPLPYEGRSTALQFGFHGYEFESERAAAMTDAGRVLIPGHRDKTLDDNYFRLTGTLRGLRIEIWAMREQVCERVVTGTREVTREVPDPDALAAVPTVTVTETVEDVTWECRPILAGASS